VLSEISYLLPNPEVCKWHEIKTAIIRKMLNRVNAEEEEEMQCLE
jgi:hypothetical protein